MKMFPGLFLLSPHLGRQAVPQALKARPPMAKGPVFGTGRSSLPFFFFFCAGELQSGRQILSWGTIIHQRRGRSERRKKREKTRENGSFPAHIHIFLAISISSFSLLDDGRDSNR